MRPDFVSLRNFDYANSTVHLWVFKRSTTATKFSAWYAQTDNVLNNKIIGVVQSEMKRITECANYTHLSQTNENSCLETTIQGCNFTDLKNLVDRPEPDHRIRSLKDLRNASGYLVKFSNNGQVIYAVKRTASNWRTSYLKTHINIVFNNGELSAAEDNGFAIEKYFDFYALNGAIFISNKSAFESVMEHRASYAQAFSNLQLRPDFSGLFTDIQVIRNYVGTNSIQLRRMARIEERGLFTRPGFLSAVQLVNGRRNWGLNFDNDTGRLIPCEQTVRTIMQVLLDHRLLSEVTELIYDVPDAVQV
ncbi:hypothetical protein AEST_22340 [Alishewanella aestuarii B11]|uniref:DUF4868 domain-containing protein n=1 Tax=Alishewanella aestuarii B11 TaxID=1197174 RepID=J2ID96_9ALTE|nr:DUF4868 domain-containing protein [Alishewanella aestuarii]EJI85132.1 hypothetical protein AEST_22340 [Alishewanella aestuarii B11]